MRGVSRAGVLRFGCSREESRPALIRSYRRPMSTTRAVVRETVTMARRLGQRLRTATATTAAQLQRVQRRLRELRPIVEQVLHQTRARVLTGDAHVADKVVSLFEPHTAVIRKGKKAKPTEFGNLITIQEAEHQIIAACAIHDGRPADRTLWGARPL
jgi:IS5 family transposase